MSASREKQNRQEQASTGWIDPKTAREAEQRRQEKRTSILYGVIGVIFAIAVVATLVWRSNVIPKMSTAATIDGEKYTAAEVNFYYQNAYQNLVNQLYQYGMLSYAGLDTSSSLKDQTISSMGAMFTGATEGEGFTYPAGVQAQYDDSIAALESAAKASNLSVSQYLKNRFGATMSRGVYEEHLMRMLRYDARPYTRRCGGRTALSAASAAGSAAPDDACRARTPRSG